MNNIFYDNVEKVTTNMTLAPSHPQRIGNWSDYYQAVCVREPSFLARITLPHVDFRGAFLDVGSGSMNDSRLALEEGFHRVEALDGSAHASLYASDLIQTYKNRFRFSPSLFQDFDFGESRFHWIHSNFALPYFGPVGFREFIERIKAGITDSGVISAIFFGTRDEQHNVHRNFAHVTEAEIRDMFCDFKLILLKELEYDGHLHDGTPKHWHYFRVIAKKSDDSL